VAANFRFHNPLTNLILRHRIQVDGQLADIYAKVAGHVAANFSCHKLLPFFMLRHGIQVGGQLADITAKVGGHVAANFSCHNSLIKLAAKRSLFELCLAMLRNLHTRRSNFQAGPHIEDDKGVIRGQRDGDFTVVPEYRPVNVAWTNAMNVQVALNSRAFHADRKRFQAYG